jgi:hypothetical protein
MLVCGQIWLAAACCDLDSPRLTPAALKAETKIINARPQLPTNIIVKTYLSGIQKSSIVWVWAAPVKNMFS